MKTIHLIMVMGILLESCAPAPTSNTVNWRVNSSNVTITNDGFSILIMADNKAIYQIDPSSRGWDISLYGGDEELLRQSAPLLDVSYDFDTKQMEVVRIVTIDGHYLNLNYDQKGEIEKKTMLPDRPK